VNCSACAAPGCPGTCRRADAERLLGKALEHEYNLADLLRGPAVGFDTLTAVLAAASGRWMFHVKHCAENSGPRTRRCGDRAVPRSPPNTPATSTSRTTRSSVPPPTSTCACPPELDYGQVTALSYEVRQKLSRHRPATLGQASRISGMTPAAISLLLVHLKKPLQGLRIHRIHRLRRTGTGGARRSPRCRRARRPAGAWPRRRRAGPVARRRQPDRLLAYRDLLLRWNATYNLTAVRDPAP
jgi:hypothetical protein